ncbi:MAG: hypothetical protein HY537_05330 [Deltaproteobacteria bacterium]|nr:hypothetical protein [Deltaproteobacteria bacterium]
MSTDKKTVKDVKELLDGILDFGPENPTNPSDDATDRIRQIVKKLQEISRRIDHLSSQL